MIEKLTDDQLTKVSEYRDRYFQAATSTEPADRERAEEAAKRLADICGVKISDILWAKSPSDVPSLRDSLWDSLGETGWLSFSSYCVDILEINIDDQAQELLRLYNEIATSCFAVWIIPGAIILCDRPKSVEIVNKRLVGIEWGSK